MIPLALRHYLRHSLTLPPIAFSSSLACSKQASFRVLFTTSPSGIPSRNDPSVLHSFWHQPQPPVLLVDVSRTAWATLMGQVVSQAFDGCECKLLDDQQRPGQRLTATSADSSLRAFSPSYAFYSSSSSCRITRPEPSS